ncbi:MAG: methyltransferase domain-containing protein [Rhodobacteraceae bacterium]|nr:methyltransferase domain-containing protein [Paracoccaceae bacterium]
MTNRLFPTLGRRDLFASAAAAAASATAASLNTAEAKEMAKESVRTMTVRGYNGIYPRMPTLKMETRGEFYAGLYKWRLQEMEKAADAHAMELLRANGIDPMADMSWGEAVALLEGDPLIAMTCRARSSHQKLKYQMLQNEYYKRADEFLSEMERADKMGPGTLELNPKMDIPEYTAREIHSMPGGYVGDPFAGHLYHAGTDWGAYVEVNYQDGAHMQMAKAAATPADGKVKRILDLGTSIGQFATSMKRRFPDAEVWGLDIGGPMVRYAHMKAADMGVDVNFAQRLCEKSGFPDNHFDIVTSNLLFHEVNEQGAKDIIKEVARVLRPGGVYSSTDTNDTPPTAKGKYTLWYNYRWNHEDWYADWHRVDFKGEMEKNGLKVKRSVTGRFDPKYVAIKV